MRPQVTTLITRYDEYALSGSTESRTIKVVGINTKLAHPTALPEIKPDHGTKKRAITRADMNMTNQFMPTAPNEPRKNPTEAPNNIAHAVSLALFGRVRAAPDWLAEPFVVEL
jgi:hypothetical protein